MRGEVFIAPAITLDVPADGSMIDPASGPFWASWQDDDGVIEDAEFDGAESAIAWGRARAETVLIRLGNRGDTYFSAGVVMAEDDDGPMPLWPPNAPPTSGWWVPPMPPTIAEVEAVAADVAQGRMSGEDAAAWAFPRLSAVVNQGGGEPVIGALAELTSGWIQTGGKIVRAADWPHTATLQPPEDL